MSTFNPPADIAQITLAKSSDVNAVKAATAIAFGLLPSETKLQRGTVNFAVDTGTANTYVVALDSSITSYTDGLQVVFRPLNDNTGSATINLNSLGAKSIRLTDSEPIQAGDISAGAVIDVRYSTSTGFFHLTPNSAIYAHDAGVSATAAAASASTASTQATNAASSASSASTSASSASTSATNAATSASSMTASVASCTASQTAAATSATNAATSASGASTSATTATTQAGIATTQAGIATTQATNASTSASTASTQATNAANSASTASTQATAAGTSATNAATSASSASTSASTATTQAGIATTQAGLATTNGAAQVALATTQATNAATSATNAASSASAASTSASNASTSASTATTQASNASTSATNAANSATAAAASYDSFDDRYLGAKASDPSVDNDGNALLTGALYWNTTSSEMRVYSGSAWITSYLPASGYLALSGGTMTGAITFASGQFGTNVNTFLSTPSSANLAAALTDETGSGATVFANTPTLIAPILGTPTSGTLTNCTFPTLNQSTTGNALTATTATNLASGSVGTIPYQTASGTTAMLAVGTSGQVLTSNGAAAPTWATASGGGTATGTSYTNPTAAGTSAAAFGSGASAASNYSTSLGANSSGTQGSVTATGSGAMALGGSYASGTDSFAAAVANNTSSYGATGSGSSIAMGFQAKATSISTYTGIALGSVAYQNNIYGGIAIGYHPLASGAQATAIGYYAIASGDNSISFGGANSSATGYLSVVLGGYGGVAAQTGKYVFGSYAMSTLGDAQSGKIVLRAVSTNVVYPLTSDGSLTASTTNQLIVASGQAMAIQGTLIARPQSSGDMVAYNITGAVSNNGGTMAVTGLALTLIGTDSIGLTTAPTIAVDNTNKGVTITSGLKTGSYLRWVATLNTSEVTYA